MEEKPDISNLLSCKIEVDTSDSPFCKIEADTSDSPSCKIEVDTSNLFSCKVEPDTSDSPSCEIEVDTSNLLSCKKEAGTSKSPSCKKQSGTSKSSSRKKQSGTTKLSSSKKESGTSKLPSSKKESGITKLSSSKKDSGTSKSPSKRESGTSKLSSCIKNPSGKPVLSGQKRMIITLHKGLKEEYPEMRYKPMIKCLSEKTGIGQLTISKTLAEYRRTGSVTSPNTKRPRLSVREKTSDEEKKAIRKKVRELWAQKESPSMKRILQVVNDDPQLPDFSESTLYRLLKSMHFKFIDRTRKSTNINKNCASP